MLKKTIIALVTLGMVLPASASMAARKSPELNPERTVYISGEVGRNAIEAGNTILGMANKSKEDIYLVINSPGGSVVAGYFTLQAMDVAKSRGIKIKCLVPGLAASMAFQILGHCDERYVLKNTLLLWHPVRVFMRGALTPSEAQYLADDLKRTEKSLVNDIFPRMGLDEDTFMYHYYRETLFTAEQLMEIAPDFVVVVEDMPGIGELYHFRDMFADEWEADSKYEIRFQMNNKP